MRHDPVLRRCTDDERWDRLVAAHPEGTPFHLAGFLRTIGGVFGLEVRLLEAGDGDEPAALVPLLVRRRGPLALANHGLPVPYVGPLLRGGVGLADVLAGVRRELRPFPVVHYGVKALQPITAPAAPGWAAFGDYQRAVIPVEGRDDDALLGQFSSRQRTAFRRAGKDGLTAGPATREEIAAAFTGWANQPYARQGLPARWPTGAHLAVHDALAPSGVAVTTAIRRDGELLALSTDLLLGRRSFGWELGLSDQGRALGATVLLCMDGLRRARDRGAVEYDLLGVPTPGIATFKRGLGARIEPVGVAEWVSPAVPALKKLAGVARRPGLPGRRRLAGGMA